MKRQSFRQRIIDLEVGGKITISADSVGETTVRSYASDLGWRLNRKYVAHRDRDARTYTIERTA
jgi:hypothetical protein